MRCLSIAFVVATLVSGTGFAQEQHNVTIRNNTFTPAVVKAEPGDSIRWAITTFTGNATITSGADCTADGLFQLGISGGPFGNNSVTWDVPLDIELAEIPYFDPAHCAEGMTGLIRIIDVREVPGEYPTIQDALDAAEEYDTISIAAGTYFVTGLTPTVDNVLIRGELDADGEIAVVLGPEAGTTASPSIMSINDLQGIEVEGIHFTGGRATSGGGIAIDDASATIRNCLFTDHVVESGGAVFASDSEVTLVDCRIRDNLAQNGGGASFSNVTGTITDCWVSNNTASALGGGLFLENSPTTISDTMFCANSTDQIAGDWIYDGGVAFEEICPFYTYTQHIVEGTTGSFDPLVIEVEPGDTIRWSTRVSSGPPCAPDGLFTDLELSGGPFDNWWAFWEVPLDIGLGEIPYFATNACDTMFGLIRVVDVHRVPGEFSTIQDALDVAVDSDMILIEPGTYHETDLSTTADNVLLRGERDEDGAIAVVLGPEPGTIASPSIISVNGVESLMVEGIHFTGSRAFSGGAINFAASSGIVENCLFTDNTALTGGAINGSGSDVALIGCTFTDNSAEYGGAALLSGGTGAISDCLFENNQAFEATGGPAAGGAIKLDGCEVQVSRSRIINNGAFPMPGGGIHAESGSLTIVRSMIQGNSASVGGGLFLSGTDTVITSSRICANSDDQISGPWTDGGSVSVGDDCTTFYVPGYYETFMDAVDASGDGDTIYVAAGTYEIPSQYGLRVEGRSLTVIGETADDGTPATILDGLLVFLGASGVEVELENVACTALYLADCMATVTNCVIENGQGVLLTYVEGTFTDCRVSGNSGNFFPVGLTQIDMDDPLGDVEYSNMTFINCLVDANYASGCPPPISCDGRSGVAITQGTAQLIGCTIRDNYAYSTAGVYISTPLEVSLTDTTVCGNMTPGQIIGPFTDNGGNTVAIECPPDCPADLDGDGTVGGADLTMLLADWGQSGSPADLDGNGTVGGADLTVLLGTWGQPCGG